MNDWRGTPIDVGSIVVYSGGEKWSKHQAEGEVISLKGANVTVKPLRRSIKWYSTQSKGATATMPLERVTVIA